MTPDGDAVSVRVLGLILAHELGHYLGLFHVPESSGLPDHIAHTDPDSQNVMDSAPNGPGLTPIQINVLRAHPALEPMILR